MTDFTRSNFFETNFKAFSNLRHNLEKYLLHIMKDNNQNKQCGKGKISKRPEHSAGENESSNFINIEQLTSFFIDECEQNFLQVDPCFISYFLHLLIRDNQDGLHLNLHSQDVSVHKLEQFLLKALAKYKNRLDVALNCMKISYYFKNLEEINFNFVKDKYEYEFNKKLKQLINSILQYPETSSDKQLEELFLKMQIFIITNYQIGYPENHVLLKKCRQALNSILGKGDIKKYVLRKKYHRLEYLQKLGATAVGILIFNNQGPENEKRSMRNIFADLKMAKRNTKDFLQEGFERVFCLKQQAIEVILQLFEINAREKFIIFLRPQAQIQEINKFVVLFEIYRNKLENIKAMFHKAQFLIEVHQKKFDCVIEKINEILKYRSAIESEVVFPHFVYLSELWNSLVMSLNHLVEINKTKEHLDSILSEELENKFNEVLKDLDKNEYAEPPLKYSFQELILSTNERDTKIFMLKINPVIKDYCALTFALTGGVLIPSKLEKKLSENINFRFGFSNVEYAKFAEYNFKDFLKVFHNTLLTNSHLIVLFELDEQVIKQDLNSFKKMQPKTKSLETQTEMISNEYPSENRTKSTWNIWDFYRETIKLANIRKRQTHSTQSNLSFGTRNAQNQCDGKTNNATQI